MSRDFTDINVDSDVEIARRKSFIARMEQKLELKEAHDTGRN